MSTRPIAEPDSNATIPGFYGKIPLLGEFVSRRLPREFVAAWDEWLRQILFAAKQRLGGNWAPTYARAPKWRFLLFPGQCGPAIWTGVLAPSADNGNRQFPFTIAARLDRIPLRQKAAELLCDWLDSMEQITDAILQKQLSFEQLDSAISSRALSVDLEQDKARGTIIAQLSSALTHRGKASDFIPFERAEDIPALLSALLDTSAATPFLNAATGKGVWWTENRSSIQLLCCEGLPKTEQFISMLLAANR